MSSHRNIIVKRETAFQNTPCPEKEATVFSA